MIEPLVFRSVVVPASKLRAAVAPLALAAALTFGAPAADAQSIPFLFFNMLRHAEGPCCYHHSYSNHSYHRRTEYAHRAVPVRRQQVAHAKGPAVSEPANENASTGAGATPAAEEPGGGASVKPATLNVETTPRDKPNLVVVPRSSGNSAPSTAAVTPAAPAPAGGATASNAGPGATPSAAKPAAPGGPGGGSFY